MAKTGGRGRCSDCVVPAGSIPLAAAVLFLCCATPLMTSAAPPSISVTHPPPDAAVESGGNLEVACEVQGLSAGGGQVGVYVDGQHGGDFPVEKNGPYTFTLPPLPKGPHSVLLQLTHEQDAEARVSFTTKSPPPSLRVKSPGECTVVKGEDVAISVTVSTESDGEMLMLSINGHDVQHGLSRGDVSLSISQLPAGLHYLRFKLIDSAGRALAQSKVHWITTGGTPFTFDASNARRDTPGMTASLLAPLYACLLQHTSAITPALWIYDAQASIKGDGGGRAHEYTKMAVGVSPNDASFWSYHACAVYLNGTRSNVGCGMSTDCYGHVVSSFRRSMENGAVSVDVGGWIQEMVGITDPYEESELSVGLKTAVLRAEILHNRARLGQPAHRPSEGDACLDDASKRPFKCVVIYARQFLEELGDHWGPSKLAQGMGGANEAVVFMSRELARRGYFVRVYANPSQTDIGDDGHGVEWRPFWTYDEEAMRPGVFVVWWHHLDAVGIGHRAATRFMWFHYKQVHQRYTEGFMNGVDGVFAMSRYHAGQMPEHAQNKTIVSGNGIDPASFVDGENDPARLIYASHPFYGLRTLLRAWPAVRDKLPEATLEVYYGWTPGMLRHIERVGEAAKAFKKEVDELLQAPGVISKGMVGQRELTEALAGCGFYIYPCEIGEISSISLMRAQAMGSIPITSRHLDSALGETAGTFDLGPKPRQGLIGNDPEWVSDWVGNIVAAAKGDADLRRRRDEMKRWARAKFSWERVGQHWDHVFQGGLGDIDDVVPVQIEKEVASLESSKASGRRTEF